MILYITIYTYIYIVFFGVVKVAVSFSMFQALEGFPHVDVWQSRSDRSVDQIRTGRSGKVDEASWVNPKLVNHVKPLENIR